MAFSKMNTVGFAAMMTLLKSAIAVTNLMLKRGKTEIWHEKKKLVVKK